MARSMLSLDIFSTRAAMMAARSRAFIEGSGRPSLAATVISRASLPNSLDLTLSCRPLRCMMFLNWECPAIVLSAANGPAHHTSVVDLTAALYVGGHRKGSRHQEVGKAVVTRKPGAPLRAVHRAAPRRCAAP